MNGIFEYCNKMEHKEHKQEPESLLHKIKEGYEGGDRPFYKSKWLVTILLAVIFLTMGYVFSEKAKPAKTKSTKESKQKK